MPAGRTEGMGELWSEHPLTVMANHPRAPGLIQRYREKLQTRHYARRTVKTYRQWLRRVLRFHGMRHPREIG